jgi:hypothetical protein
LPLPVPQCQCASATSAIARANTAPSTCRCRTHGIRRRLTFDLFEYVHQPADTLQSARRQACLNGRQGENPASPIGQAQRRGSHEKRNNLFEMSELALEWVVRHGFPVRAVIAFTQHARAASPCLHATVQDAKSRPTPINAWLSPDCSQGIASVEPRLKQPFRVSSLQSAKR